MNIDRESLLLIIITQNNTASNKIIIPTILNNKPLSLSIFFAVAIKHTRTVIEEYIKDIKDGAWNDNIVNTVDVYSHDNA